METLGSHGGFKVSSMYTKMYIKLPTIFMETQSSKDTNRLIGRF